MGPTFFQQDSFEERVLVAQHETLVGSIAVAVLQVLQRLLVVLDGALELLDVFGAALAEGSLGLAVALLALFRGGIDLGEGELVQGARARRLGVEVWRCGWQWRGSRVCDRLCASAAAGSPGDRARRGQARGTRQSTTWSRRAGRRSCPRRPSYLLRYYRPCASTVPLGADRGAQERQACGRRDSGQAFEASRTLRVG
jgi:hypothetical protein